MHCKLCERKRLWSLFRLYPSSYREKLSKTTKSSGVLTYRPKTGTGNVPEALRLEPTFLLVSQIITLQHGSPSKTRKHRTVCIYNRKVDSECRELRFLNRVIRCWQLLFTFLHLLVYISVTVYRLSSIKLK
jgi:hypothetical protein